MDRGQKRAFLRWVGLMLKHALVRTGHGEGIGVVSLAALQTTFGWVLVVLFGASGAAALVGVAAAWWPWVTGIAAAFMIFVVAPYQLWRDEASRADEAESQLMPAISCVPSVRKTDFQVLASLRVSARGGRSLVACSVELLGAYSGVDGSWERIESVAPCLLRWSPSYGGVGDTHHSFSGTAECELFVRKGYSSNGSLWVRGSDFNPQSKLIDEKRVIPEHEEIRIDLEVAADYTQPERLSLVATISPVGLRPKRDSVGGTSGAPLPNISLTRLAEGRGP